MRRALAVLAVGALVLAVGAGFCGRLAPFFDSLAHFRAHLAALLVAASCAALAVRQRLAAGLGLAVAAGALATVLPFMLPRGAGEAGSGAPRYTLLQMNVLYRASEHTSALLRIVETRPDVVTLQEMTPGWRDTFGVLLKAYPFQFFCEWPGNRTADVAILSRRPFAQGDAGTCDLEDALGYRAVDFDGTPVTIASQHQLWPWPGQQWRRLADLAPTLAVLPKPLVVGGDFNAAPWSAAVRTFASAAAVRPVAGIGPTWFPEALPGELGRWFGLPIDNVLASEAITVIGAARLAATASDHLPVLVTFEVKRPEPTVQVAARPITARP